MKKLLAALCALLCLMLTGCELPDPAEVEAELSATKAPVAEADAQTPVRAYLLVTVADSIYQPIPLTEPGRYTVRRGECINVIEVTEDSVRMAESTCDNQDCIYQGTVTLENKDSRVLQNMILCLPNEVILELYTYDELKAVLPGWQEGQE